MAFGDWVASLRAELTDNILPYWERHAIDRERGGFHGTVHRDGTPVLGEPKALVICARVLWTFSAAERVLGGGQYRPVADWAYHALLGTFRDPEFGGYYWQVTADNQPAVTTKEVYGQAFAIYGLSEYYRATGQQAALEEAIGLFRLLDQAAHDDEHGGYFESFDRAWALADWSIIAGSRQKLGWDRPGPPKSMNTHLHLLEALASLLRVWDDEPLRQRLGELLDLFTDRIVHLPSGHMRTYFQDDWTPRAFEVSFGHDIEASWLLTEALDVLGDDARHTGVDEAAIRLAEATLREAVDADGGIFNGRACLELMERLMRMAGQREPV